MVFKNALVNGVLTDITVENGVFKKIGKTSEEGLDLCGYKVYPGLIDIHTHGCLGIDTMDMRHGEMSVFYAENGVTAYLPTTMTADLDELRKITDIDAAKFEGAQILGFHLEGPFISEKYKGAQNAAHIQKPDLEGFREIRNVKMVTLAPELAGSLDFIKNCGCVVSIGHTAANYDETVAAIEAGASCLSHTFNAMPPLNHRNPSVIGAAFDKNIYAQVICDGLHIHPSVIRILYKLFGAERMILISDSMRATGLCDGCYEFGGQEVFVKNNCARLSDGTIAGSISTLLGCVKKAVEFGISESEAFRMASRTPAELLGVNKGVIAEGFDADFIVLDSGLNVVKTVIAGRVFEQKHKNSPGRL